ncbi:MAG: cytochrome c3 family protein, partial [Phycisphaerales bacterium]|nr:cytochrome c3 family protein [Phycisphaerales bacterium]
MPGRLTTLLFVSALAGFVACAACSSTTRYHVLSFFLDGVPPPGSGPATKTPSGSGRLEAGGGVEAPPPAAPVRFFAHTPYRDNRCGGCHDTNSGQLVRPIEEGLCLTCHSSLVAEARFVHGPVAVN